MPRKLYRPRWSLARELTNFNAHKLTVSPEQVLRVLQVLWFRKFEPAQNLQPVEPAEPVGDPSYSDLSVTAGSTHAARHAGSQQAIPDTASRMAITDA